MKKFFVLLILFFVTVKCGEERNRIEVLPDYDSQYYSADDVDFAAKFSEGSDSFSNAASDIISKRFAKSGKNSIFFFKAQLYIGADGKVEKVQYKKNVIPKNSDGLKINPNLSEVYSAFTDEMSEWTFTPAILDGKDVPSQLTWNISVKVDSAGETENYLSEFLDSTVPQPPKGFSESNFFMAVEKMPAPIGGLQAIQKNIRYPELAKRAGIEGRVFIKAFIDEQGIPVVVELIKGIGAGCDEVAINAVKKTRFTPGMQRGKAVKTQVTIPIIFKLK